MFTKSYDFANAANQILFSSKIFDENTVNYYTGQVYPVKILSSLKTHLDIEQNQVDLANYLIYLTNLLQQIVKIYQLQVHDFVDVIRSILGQPFLDVLQLNNDEQSYQYKVLVKLYEDIVVLCNGTVQSYLYYACLRLS